MIRVIPLVGAETILGRDPGENGVAIPHPTASRRHLAIRWEARVEQHTVVDLGSKNGASVDGTRLGDTPRLLDDGAVVRAGDLLLVYETFDDEVADDEVGAAIPGIAATTRQLRALMRRAAEDPAHVLLLGETGTGKEHIARELHRRSGRTGPFLAVSCAELNAELMTSQLFGHVRGAFTGAQQAQPGLFRAAAGGTLLLDELGELAAVVQPKLLRVLQEGEVLPVGEGRAVPIDVRVIAATNADLPALVEAGGFRRDLYARLAFWEIVVPALRARRADILGWLELLHDRFVERRAGVRTPLLLDADAAETLLLAPWLDNLRGLDRVIHRLAASRSPGTVVTRAELVALLPTTATANATPAGPTSSPTPAPPPPPPPATRAELEAALAEHGSVRAVAKHYRRDRRQVYRWLKDLGLR